MFNLVRQMQNMKKNIGIASVLTVFLINVSTVNAEQIYGTPISSQTYGSSISSQTYGTPIPSQTYGTPTVVNHSGINSNSSGGSGSGFFPVFVGGSSGSSNYYGGRYYGGRYYGGSTGFSGYTSAYSYSGGGSTHTPTWKPNTAGWTTDYQLGYSTAEKPAVTGNNSWNPDVNSWNTDYALTYSTSHNDNYQVTCIVDDTTVDADDEVEFHAKVTGGKGDYEYEWFGDDGIDEDDDSFEHEFDRNGIYRVTVEVTDEDGFTTYDECDAVYVGRDYYTANYVQDYYTGSPQGELASQNSVYLSQVPYTGAEDVAKIFGFVALIAVWSIVIAYYFIKRKHKNTISNRIADFKKANLAARA